MGEKAFRPQAAELNRGLHRMVTLIGERGAPPYQRSDNGPEFVTGPAGVDR